MMHLGVLVLEDNNYLKPMKEKVGDFYQYYTSVTSVRTVYNNWHTIATPVIGVYTTDITVPNKSKNKKSWKQALQKLFRRH